MIITEFEQSVTVSQVVQVSYRITDLIAVLLTMSWSPVVLFLIMHMLKSSRGLITRAFTAESCSFCTKAFENKVLKMA